MERWEDEEREEDLPLLVYFLDARKSLEWARLRPGVWNSFQVCNMSGRN